MSCPDVMKKLQSLRFQRKTLELKEINYLKNINIPSNIITFHEHLGIVDSIDINRIELLSIEKLKIENEECIPGYLLFPLGYSIIASTIYGDVYCIERNCELYDSKVFMASHEEIYEGLSDNQINESIVKVCNSFLSF